jgi:hypothetical protein
MKKSGSRKRKALVLLFILLLLPVLIVLLAIQPFFLQAVILPQVEKATDTQISVAQIQLSPLSSLSLSGLNLQSNDQRLKIKADTALIRYDLIAMLKGTVVVDELTLSRPNIQYTPPRESDPRDVTSGNTEQVAGKTPTLDIHNVNIVNGVVHLVLPEGNLTISGLNFRLPELVNGQPLRPTLQAELSASTHENPELIFMKGVLDANLEVGMSESLQPTGLKGNLEAVIGENQAGVPQMTMKLDTDLGVDLDQGLLNLQSLSIVAVQERTPLLRMQLSNPTQVQWKQQPPVFTDSQLVLNLPRVEIPSLPFAQLLPIQSGSIYIESQLTVSASGKKINAVLDFGLERLLITGPEASEPLSIRNFSGKGSLDWVQGEDVAAVFELNVENLKLPDGKSLPSPLTVKLDTRATLDHATLHHLDIAWAESPGYPNRVLVNGDLNWQDPQAITGQVNIRGQAVDLDPWGVFLTQSTPAADTAPSRTKADAPAANAPLNLPTLPLQSVTLDLDIEKIHFKELILSKLRMQADAGPHRLSLEPLSFTLNNSTFSAKAQADWQDPQIKMQLTGSLSPLDLQPVFDSFVPEKQGAVTGILQGKTEFQVTGDSPQALMDSFQGQVQLSYSQGKLRLLNTDPEQHTALLHTRKLVQDVVSGMAEALQLSPAQLMEPEIESVSFETALVDKRLMIRKAEILNPEFMMAAQGEIHLAGEPGNAKIMQLPLVLGVSTNLAKRVKIYRPERVKGDYVVLPAFLEVKGSLGAPEIKIKKGVVTGLIISGVTERNEIGNENVQKGLDILGTLLTGEPPAQKPTAVPTPLAPGATPPPTPKPGKTEKVLEGLRLFQELRATPTPENPRG